MAALEALARAPAVVPAALALGVVIALATAQGGYFVTAWAPAALFALGLVAVCVLALPLRGRVPRPALVAAGLVAAYAAWSYLSIAWADDQGAALAGANRTLLYAAVFALFALWPQTDRSALLLIALLGLGIAAVGLVELLKLAGSERPQTFFIDTRLAQPVGYHNGDVALWFLGFWPCAFVAARREAPSLLRALALGGAGLLVGLALMGQSRGWFFSVPVVILFFVAVTPGRGRVIAALVALGLAGLLMSGPVLDVGDSFSTGPELGRLVDRAAHAILLAAAGLALGGLVVALADRRIRATERVGRAVSAAIVVVAALVVAGGFAAWVAKEGNPATSISKAWREFKRGDLPKAGQTRFTASLGSGRYDIWRVAWERFKAEPVRGTGADNFQQDYLARGKTLEQPLYPHSVELRVLSQTGMVGAVLLLGALMAAGVAAFHARTRAGPAAAAVAGGALTTFLYWLAHGSVDWFWEIPALGAGAFAMLGLAVSLAPRRRPAELAEPRPARRLVPVALVLAALVAGAVAVAFPWGAERQVDRATKIWPARPARAFDLLDEADALNPLSSRPRLVKATIALRLRRLGTAAREFRAALARDPRNSYAVLELGAIASQRGRRAPALRLLRRARRLTPRDAITADALARAESGRRVNVTRMNARIRTAARQVTLPN